MALTEIFLNAKFTVTLVMTDADGDVVVLTGRTMHFYYRDPSGNETIDESPTTDDEAGEVVHVFAADALDELGVWECKAYVATDQVQSTKYNFRVIADYDR